MYRSKKPLIFTVTLLLLVAATVFGALAFLVTQTNAIQNIFNPSKVTCEVTESFNGTVKSNVNVTNTGDIPAYIRVKLVTYRVNDNNVHIGGTAEIPAFEPGEGWFFHTDGFYYYKSPVKSMGSPDTPLIDTSGIQLVADYTVQTGENGSTVYDFDGGKQVIEVMAEAIQADGTDGEGAHAVTLAWGIEVDNDGNLVPNSSGEVQG